MNLPATPIRRHGYLHRRGLPTITGPMMAVLIQLRAAQQGDNPFVALPGIDPRTIRALEERDWIVSSPQKLGCVYYKATGRGLHALKVYEPVVKRTDGLCPRCCVRPRVLFSSGRQAPYCKECSRQLTKRKYDLGLYRPKKQGMCVRCQKRPRYVASTGRVYVHCQHCKNLLHRRQHRRQRKELLERVLAGEHVACCRVGCDQPRYVSGKTVQDYCWQHFREYQNDYNHRRRESRRKKKGGDHEQAAD